MTIEEVCSLVPTFGCKPNGKSRFVLPNIYGTSCGFLFVARVLSNWCCAFQNSGHQFVVDVAPLSYDAKSRMCSVYTGTNLKAREKRSRSIIVTGCRGRGEIFVKKILKLNANGGDGGDVCRCVNGANETRCGRRSFPTSVRCC